jgi:predicted amidophosphoribosyltransferase
VRFLYKIYSNFDGFTPRQIPKRLQRGRFLSLRWNRYLDSVDVGAECWIYFHGHHAFSPGVYVYGYISSVDRGGKLATLRVREHRVDRPLTDRETTTRIANAVSVRYRQVFLWPDEWNVIPACGISSCRSRLCDDCEIWKAIPIIDPGHFAAPAGIAAFVVAPAYWIIPNRCYVYREHKRTASWTDRISHVFGEFKLGEKAYAYPLARGMFEALKRRNELEFDAIVPIPLSPDKETAGEVHRTRLLSQELGRLLGVPVRDYLSLATAVSKRRMQAAGYTLTEFRQRYLGALAAHEKTKELERVLLVDDVITSGSTTWCATRRLLEQHESLGIVVASAGQMIVKPVVRVERGFVE